MKILAYTFLFLILGYSLCSAQQLRVVYVNQNKHKVDLNKVSDEISDREMYEAIKEAMQRKTEFELVINGQESLYKEIEKIDNSQVEPGRIRVVIRSGAQHQFTDLSRKEILSKAKSADKEFLVTDSLKNFDWQLTRDREEYLGYEVRKAISRDAKQTTVAWYAPAIKLSHGPAEFQGLPGLILKVETTMNDKEESVFTWLATSVQVLDKLPQSFARPTQGQRVTRNEFKEINEAHNKRLNEMYGGGIDKD
ncbi:MAG: GLPGLI family protein [Weeksellaceae bacterium]|nr:GLPGLI family protein [Weeksellaceae bacterium]